MLHISINNDALYYEFDDFGKKETIVFSNSLGTNLSMWAQQLGVLKRHFNILRYDTRGHGKSSTPTPDLKGETYGYSVAELGQDVVALLDYLKLENVHFCGLSLGGLIGQWLSINAPNRFKKIIICNTGAKIGNTEGWNGRIEQVAKNGLESITSGTAERWFTEGFRTQHPSVVSSILDNFIKTDIGGYVACCAAVRDADFREQLSTIKVPILVISGSKDPVTTVADGNFLAQNIPNARHISLDTAHLSNVEKGEEFSTAVLGFLTV